LPCEHPFAFNAFHDVVIWVIIGISTIDANWLRIFYLLLNF